MKFMTSFIMSVLVMFASMFSTAHAQISGGGGSPFVAEYVYDFAKHGGAVGFIALKGSGANALPSNAVVLSAHYQVLTAMTSGGSATVSLGDAASGARYLALTAFDNAAYDANVPKAVAIGMPLLVSSANIASPGITVAVAALTAGKIRVVLQGYVPRGQ